MTHRPEVLAPAGDEASLDAAMRAGADAVYFGLGAFNARARATNMDPARLSELVATLHARGVKAYVTLNTLVFEHEFDALAEAIRACAEAGVDAVIVQDLGVLTLVQAIAPSLRIHASTQMTCTDAGSVRLAASLGARRVVLARELSIAEIATIAEGVPDVELEVFVHGALCVAYSGQCLTSEAIGGRSANRGACAQSCRLPYGLVVDGALEDLGELAYLLSPEDLEATRVVPELASIGVHSLKIEGRLKGPAYVAATTRLYRAAVDGELTSEHRQEALQTYSRGSGPGFLEGVDHQRLVEARGCDHRGVRLGTLTATEARGGKRMLALTLETDLARGDGILVEGGREGHGEVGGRVWTLEVDGEDRPHARPGDRALVWLGPDVDPARAKGPRVFRTDAPRIEKAVLAENQLHPHREPLHVTVRAHIGEPLVVEATSRRGLRARVEGEPVLEASKHPLDLERTRAAFDRLGETSFALGGFEAALDSRAFVPLSKLGDVRRALIEALERDAHRALETTSVRPLELLERAPFPATPPAAGLFVTVRNVEQARAALEAGADGVYLDFLELTGVGHALRALRTAGARFVGVAPPRIRKPGEEKIQRYLDSLDPDAFLVRGLGLLREVPERTRGVRGAHIGDFSLNVTNRLSASTVLDHGLIAFTPSHDLDSAQLGALVATAAGPFAEVVIHHPMPLFHMEHCVFAARLSQGRDHRTCGRPCDTHTLALRDRAGMDHPVQADVGCRNTVFHARAQSAAHAIHALQASGVGRFRIEVVREGANEVAHVVRAYRRLLAGSIRAAELLASLRVDGHVGVVRGSLRVLGA